MSCQLVSAENESILWSTSVQVEPDQIGNSIDTACIELVNWLDGPRASTDTRGDIDSTAYTYWLRALALLDRGDPISFNVARAYLDDAVQRAPRSAVIHAYLALWYAQSALARRLPLSEAFASANQEADVALQLNSASAEAHLARAVVAFFSYARDEAEVHFRRTLDVSPNHVETHHRYARFLACHSRFESAIAHARRAQILDPLSRSVHLNAGIVLYAARDFHASLIESEKALALNPASPSGLMQIGVCELVLGRYSDAIQRLRQAVRFSQGHIAPAAYLSCAYALAGREEFSRRIYQRVRTMCISADREGWSNWTYLAVVCACRGTSEEAVDALKRAVARRDPELLGIAVDPLFDSIRASVGFREAISAVYVH